jgi:hypothetical protein
MFMAKRKEFDAKRLAKMVKDGVAQNEIMKKFGFNTSTQLKVAYANAMIEAGKIPEIQSSRGGKPSNGVIKEVSVSKRGSLIIPKELIEELGFKVGGLFLARKTKAGISLKLL